MRRNAGFTLVELLVVIAIIGVLVGLLLPAVQAAREAARRMQCSNNLKQIGLAMHNYETALRRLPPSHIAPWNGDAADGGWGAVLLPYLEQSALYDRYDWNTHWWEDGNQRVVASPVATYQCPSDSGGEEVIRGIVSTHFNPASAFDNPDAHAAMGDYVTIHGSLPFNGPPGDIGLIGALSVYNPSPGANSSLGRPALSWITDGMSNTIAFAEQSMRSSPQMEPSKQHETPWKSFAAKARGWNQPKLFFLDRGL